MKTKAELFEGYNLPTCNIQEVLLTLILQGHVSLFDFPVMAGFRTRVSNLCLQYGLKLETIKSKRCNKFGNSYTYHIHKLPKDQKEFAIELYNKLQTK
jgi:hypothetical protein